MRLCSFLLAVVLLGISALIGQAAVLVQYDFQAAFSGSGNTTNSAASTVGGNVTASPFATNGMIAVRSGTGPSFAVTTSQMSNSIDLAKYLNFTLSANPGYQLNLSSLSFAAANAASSAPFPDGRWEVRSSVDSYSSSLGTFSSNTTASSFESKSVTLSGSQFQNLSTIQFRIYLWDDDNTNAGTKSLRTGAVTLDGTVAVIPEPSVLALLFGGLGILSFMRRQRGVLS